MTTVERRYTHERIASYFGGLWRGVLGEEKRGSVVAA